MGIQYCTNFATRQATATIPFIFLTAKASAQDIREGMTLGADDYLTKPFKIDELLSAIQTQLKKHAAAQQQLEDLRLKLSIMLPHEFRTPLSAILGYSSLLKTSAHTLTPEKIRHMAEGMHQGGPALTATGGKLFDVSRSEAQRTHA